MKWIQDPKTHELIPADEYYARSPLDRAESIQIIKDIDPYRAVATDKATGKRPVIGSRREHKEFLKRNNYFEVGTEKPKPFKPTEMDSVLPDLHRVLQRKMP